MPVSCSRCGFFNVFYGTVSAVIQPKPDIWKDTEASKLNVISLLLRKLVIYSLVILVQNIWANKDICVGYLYKGESNKHPNKSTLMTDKHTQILLLNLCPWRRNGCIFYLQIILFCCSWQHIPMKKTIISKCCCKRPSVFLLFGGKFSSAWHCPAARKRKLCCRWNFCKGI